MFCKLCNKEIQLPTQSFHRLHLKKEHGINSKEYYDSFLRSVSEGLCETCSLPTTYLNFTLGYTKHCSRKCLGKDTDTQKLRENSKIKRYGSKNNSAKIASTVKEKYGVSNVSQLDSIKEKKKKTFIKNYGVENYALSVSNRVLKEAKGLWIPEDKIKSFVLYSRKVRGFTKKNKSKLLEDWDGTCYYSGKVLNKALDCNSDLYPTIDHKISIYRGFIENTSAETIGSLNNLCIASRKVNNEKGTKSLKEFMEIIKCRT